MTDGYSVIQSEKSGAVKVLQIKMEFTLKCSCFSHVLNLSIMIGYKQKFYMVLKLKQFINNK